MPRWLERHPLTSLSPSTRQLAWRLARAITMNPDHAPGINPLVLRRLDARTLSIRAEHGLLQPLGTWRADGPPQVEPVSQVYAAQLLSQATRGDRPFARGSHRRAGRCYKALSTRRPASPDRDECSLE